MVRELLATLTTDETGRCTYTYTGTGRGEIDFVATHTNDSGIIQSETYELLDCIAIDNGTQSDHNDDCWSGNGKSSMVRNTDYTTLEYDGSVKQIFLGGLTENCVIDFELKRLDIAFGSGFINLFTQDPNVSLTWYSLGNLGISATSDWLQLRMTVRPTSSTLTLVSDPIKTYTRSYTATGTPTYMRLIVSSDITGFNIRNVKVYPI